MRKTDSNLLLLNIVFVSSLITSNVVTTKLVATNLFIQGIPIVLPGAVFCYMLTFLITDLIGEIWGKKEANQCVKLGLIGQVVSMLLILLTKYVPNYDPQIGNAYNLLLGQSWIFVLASLSAYLVAQSWDVFIFHKIRNYILKKTNNKNLKWIWNNISTITSQLLDTMIYIVIAFGIGFNWIVEKPLILLGMILGQYVFKVILAILDTPIFYILTKEE